jgi:DNA (cytosine-5)-methyltransferase 1
MVNLRVLDLFCGAGGAAVGLHRAGLTEIVGVDIEDQPDYPFEFIKADATDPPVKIEDFDLIWASPPCQLFSSATSPRKHGNRARHGKEYPNLIPKVRELLKLSGRPYIIENVPQAPLNKSLILCGKMFGLKVYRHRIFEIFGFRCEQPRHPPHIWSSMKGEIFCICGDTPISPGFGMRKVARREHRKKWKEAIFKEDITTTWQKAMDVPHIKNRLMISEAIPPAYSEYIGRAAMAVLVN